MSENDNGNPWNMSELWQRNADKQSKCTSCTSDKWLKSKSRPRKRGLR